jgi:hypothetical protein
MGLPDFALKGCACGVHRKAIDGANVPGKIIGERIGETVRILFRLHLDVQWGVNTLERSPEVFFAVCPERCAESPIVIAYDVQFTDGRWKMIDQQAQGLSHVLSGSF